MTSWKILRSIAALVALGLASTSGASSLGCSTPGTASHPSGPCDTLATCCASSSFPAAGQGGCKAIAALNDDGSCSAALTSDRAAGFCSSPGSPGSPDASDPAAGPCGLLAKCCAKLGSGMSAGCSESVQAANAATCASLLASYQAGAMCSGICAADTDCGGGQVCDVGPATCVDCTSNAQCRGATPACDAMSHTCTECGASSDCAAPTPACDVTRHVCVECEGDPDCHAPRPACDASTKRCVECSGGAQCKSGECNPGGTCCVPSASSCAYGYDCGEVPIGCGKTANCGSCPLGTCVSNRCVTEGVACSPGTLACGEDICAPNLGAVSGPYTYTCVQDVTGEACSPYDGCSDSTHFGCFDTSGCPDPTLGCCVMLCEKSGDCAKHPGSCHMEFINGGYCY